ncbi:tumor necrosis factor receptor superfamily member 3 [Xenopus laevis]|uniref:Tumor necrosis factor receptor superfamily member 3 n=2 Tax=Xenopus laevis TaxID=8355 RepID=A0A1L8FIN3_XENLA|nr:tumor necrosis factor receptor superfamily member 3 [Xenopus laevis]OCT71446.1 hypothetical protein XELAEV_18034426mg [Xenopus laevis]
MKVGPVLWLFFLLVVVLWREAQQAPGIEKNCGEHEYFHLKHKKCCSKCPPGTYASSQCNATSNTTCTPCPADFYNEKWIYANRCKMCWPCPKDTGLVATVNCSATTATECGCQDGFVCELYNPLGKCMHCRRVTTPTTTVESTTDHRTNGGHIDPSDNGTPLWIIIPVTIGLICLGLIILLLVTNTHVLKGIVRAMGIEKDNKPSSLNTADARTEQDVAKTVLLPTSKGTQSTDLSENPAEAILTYAENSPMQTCHLSESTNWQSSGYVYPFKVAPGCNPHLSIPVMLDDDHLHFPIQEETNCIKD